MFLSTLILSAFTLGGGFVIVSLMKKRFIDKLHWINDDEMLNLIAIAQASPGAIVVNGSILIGYRIAVSGVQWHPFWENHSAAAGHHQHHIVVL